MEYHLLILIASSVAAWQPLESTLTLVPNPFVNYEVFFTPSEKFPSNNRSTLSVNSRSGTMSRAQKSGRFFFHADGHEIGGLFLMNPSANQKVLLQSPDAPGNY